MKTNDGFYGTLLSLRSFLTTTGGYYITSKTGDQEVYTRRFREKGITPILTVRVEISLPKSHVSAFLEYDNENGDLVEAASTRGPLHQWEKVLKELNRNWSKVLKILRGDS